MAKKFSWLLERIYCLGFIYIGSSFISTAAQAQTSGKTYTHELEFTTDNDVYLFDVYDKYYTNGIQLDWRHALPDSSGFVKRFNRNSSRLRKAVVGLSLAQKIYSPRLIYSNRSSDLDRAYAGWLSLTGNASMFLKQKDVLQVQVDVGTTGKLSGGEWLQNHWHKWFGLPQPRHWEYQIEEKWTSHLQVNWTHQLLTFPSGDLLTESSGRVGNLLSNLRQGVTLRLGNIGPLYHSSYTHSRLGSSPSDDREFYFFVGTAQEYVFQNGLIDGNLQDGLIWNFGESRSWVTHWRTGITYASKAVTFNVSMNHLSPEFYGGTGHSHGSLGIALRL